MPTLYFNGKTVKAPEGVTLQNLLKLQGRDPALVVVTVDGRFIPRAEYAGLKLAVGASVLARELQEGG